MLNAERLRRKRRDMVWPAHTATWTLGPSLPTLRPDAIARGSVIVFMARLILVTWRGWRYVVNPRNPFIVNPAMMHLISLIPLPAAYGANPRTKNAEVNAKRI